MVIFCKLLLATVAILHSVYYQWAQPIKDPDDLRDVKAIMARAKAPFKFNIVVKNYHLVDYSTPTKVVHLRTEMHPGSDSTAIKLKEEILFRSWNWFCLSDALEKNPFKFDIIVGYVRFQKKQGLIVLVGKYPWDYKAEPQDFFLEVTSSWFTSILTIISYQHDKTFERVLKLTR
jgi:hypothetical protein